MKTIRGRFSFPFLFFASFYFVFFTFFDGLSTFFCLFLNSKSLFCSIYVFYFSPDEHWINFVVFLLIAFQRLNNHMFPSVLNCVWHWNDSSINRSVDRQENKLATNVGADLIFWFFRQKLLNHFPVSAPEMWPFAALFSPLIVNRIISWHLNVSPWKLWFFTFSKKLWTKQSI